MILDLILQCYVNIIFVHNAMLMYLRHPKKSEQTSIHFSEQTFGTVYL